ALNSGASWDLYIHQGNRWRRDKWVYDCKHFRLNDVSICGLNRGIMDYILSNPDRHYFFPPEILIVRCHNLQVIKHYCSYPKNILAIR
ncbi:MAG: hypothetical protein WB975_01960, partial [Nitrososphaeraceae archaeon]